MHMLSGVLFKDVAVGTRLQKTPEDSKEDCDLLVL